MSFYFWAGHLTHKGNRSYHLDQTFEVNHIRFEKSVPNLYSKTRKPQVVGLDFWLLAARHRQVECQITFCYNWDKAPTVIDVDPAYFYKLVAQLKPLEKDAGLLKEDFNVADGVTCAVIFSGENYQVGYRDNWENDSKSVFYGFFWSVWEKFVGR